MAFKMIKLNPKDLIWYHKFDLLGQLIFICPTSKFSALFESENGGKYDLGLNNLKAFKKGK